ncbi:MAG: hypothetical protein COX80_03120 [Candidatus Magasanikbacteria bacterium CG_4_10_14_0_2_um_filter_33_14]|uniref:Uncharacterized protein n=1 Tax=Candidatus Magasanikbacteria bacterium CG_4_10_14_0_2_um_filter_33_14 TaxID=1974636 RepID=A0A2M7VAN7_9BACT|nr:MAG: hypothetical protein COX80_03120 [Candidatus Magasanikbacteria bacterium CG_4_10_14_0_2_um_filter_33_14]
MKREETREPITLYTIKVDEGTPFSLSVHWPNGEVKIFQDKYVSFGSFPQAQRVLTDALENEEITTEDFLALLVKMWKMGLK